jgi:transposase
MVAHLKLLIAKLRHDRFGTSSERGRKLLDQMELQLEELEATASEAATTAAPDSSSVTAFTRRKPVRAPLPGHLPRERVVIEAPSACPCCGGTLAKLGETITETLEVIPRQWKVIQTVREKFTCRSCEKITQPPAPFHPIARGRAGANLLVMILEAKFGQHLPLNRQSETFAREGIDLDVSTLAPLVTLIRTHVMAAACTATIRPCPCWRKARPLPGDYGPMCAMTAPSPAPRHRRQFFTTHATAAGRTPGSTWPDIAAFSRLMPMADTMIFTCRRDSRGL